MNRRDTLLLAFCFASLALIARLPGLSRSLWYDELFTVVHFTGSLRDACGAQVAANNHPLASVLAWAARSLGAASSAGLRGPSLLLGVASVPALLLSRRLLGTRGALLAAALAVLAPWHVAYAQQVRGYAGLLLAATLLPPLLYACLSERAPRWGSAALGAVVLLGSYAHASAALLAGVCLVLTVAAPWLGIAPRQHAWRCARGLGVGLLLALLAYLPLLGRTWKYTRRALLEGDAGAPGRLSPLDLGRVLGDGRPLLAGCLLVAAAFGGVVLWRRSRRACLVTLVPILTACLLVVIRAPAFPRFLLVALPASLALAGVGLAALRGSPRLLIALGLVLGLSAERVAVRSGEEWQDYGGIGRLLQERAPGVQPVALRAGSGLLLATVCQPAPAELADLEALDAWLAQPGLGLVIDDFPRLTDPRRRERVRARCGPPWVLPGRVSPIAVYLRRP